MFRSIARMREMNRKVNTARLAEEKDEEGRLRIDVTVRRDDGFISPFSYGAEPVVSSEVAEFLEQSVRPKYAKSEFHLVLHSDEIDGEERRVYADAVHKSFMLKFIAERQKSRRDCLVAFIMLLCGVLLLSAMIALRFIGENAVFYEVVDIFAWVFLWEAADIFFLQRKMSHWQMHKYIGLSRCEISYVPLSGTTSGDGRHDAEIPADEHNP